MTPPCKRMVDGNYLFFRSNGDILIEIHLPDELTDQEKVESTEELMKLAIAWVGIEKEP